MNLKMTEIRAFPDFQLFSKEFQKSLDKLTKAEVL